VTDFAERSSAIGAATTALPRRRSKGQIAVKWLTTTDHKLIGHLYLTTSFIFFLIGGLMALLIRAELVSPGLQIVNEEVYNQLFTMHGTIMLLLFATPLFVGFANVIMPLQIGSPDVAFPAAQHVQLLAVPVRRPHRGLGASDPRRRRRLRLVSLHAALRRRPPARASVVTCGSWVCGWPVSARSSARSTSSPRSSACAPRHDDVPDVRSSPGTPGHTACSC
jgi:hypothetical protein